MKKKDYKLLTQAFIKHLARNIAAGFCLVLIGLMIGMWGYHQFEQMSWIDAFANASMILSGMGPFGPLSTNAGKIFAGFYALFSGLIFIAIMGLIFAPLLHHIFKKIHLDSN